MQWAPVVSPSLAFTYKGKPVDARALGRELNIRYLVEGEVRAVGDQVVVRARLTDTSNATEVWSGDVGLEQARIAKDRSELIARLAVQVNRCADRTPSIVAFLRSRSRMRAHRISRCVPTQCSRSSNPESLAALTEARKLYDQALRLDPNSAVSVDGPGVGRCGPGSISIRTRIVTALSANTKRCRSRVVAVAGREARAWNIRADALQRAWRWDAALEANARAQRIDPTRAGSIGQRADIMNRHGTAR